MGITVLNPGHGVKGMPSTLNTFISTYCMGEMI